LEREGVILGSSERSEGLEVLVLGPEGGLVVERDRVDHVIRQWQRMPGRLQGQGAVQVDELSALHDAGDLEGVILTAFAKDLLKTS
jgi:hypothetical protein